MKDQLEAYISGLEKAGKIPAGKGQVLLDEITREVDDLDSCPFALSLINFALMAGLDSNPRASMLMNMVIRFIEATGDGQIPSESNPVLLL